ncbi:MAG TPA: C25 family cysteine peptidase [Anaerolineaceae bacterium]|nr:C25 family cysteine peptidase [Anaerolineaceae bacterium]
MKRFCLSSLTWLVRAAFGLAVLLTACQAAGASPAPTLAPVDGLPVKITTGESGIYQLSSAELNIASQDSAGLHLYHQGKEVPLFIEPIQPEAFRLRFYAPAVASRYASQDVYWLALQPPAQVGTPALAALPHPQGPAGSSLRMVRMEENLLYWPMSAQPDPWFWKLYAAPAGEDFVLILPAEQEPVGTATLRVALAGKTSAPVNPDHTARLIFNGQLVLEESWDGSGEHLLRAELPANLLRSGENTLRLELPGLPEVAAEVVYLDWITVEYAAPLVALNDRLEYISDEDIIQLSGFSGEVQVYDITDPFQPTLVQSSDKNEPGRRYLAIGPGGTIAPLSLSKPELQPDLRDPALSAEWLLVGPPDLLAAAQPLIEWRAEHGVQGMAVSLQAVYDQFGGGVTSPEAIRELVRASRSWTKAPRSLLLLGDASFDPLGYQTGPEVNRLPVFFVFTEYGGETGSDLPFVDLDGDFLPDLAVGRLPARTPEQIATYVQKVISYEQNAFTTPRLAVSVADGQEASFATDAQAFMELLPADYARLVIAPLAGATDTAAQVREAFEQSPWLVAYFGHGSIQMWGKDKLFSVEDVALLPKTTHAPIVVNMTCLAGLFIHPKQESLAEALLWQAEAGASAVLAPTSLTLTVDQFQLSHALAVALSDGQSVTLGDAMLRAWRQMPVDSPGAKDVLLTFLLLGDPELRLERVP